MSCSEHQTHSDSQSFAACGPHDPMVHACMKSRALAGMLSTFQSHKQKNIFFTATGEKVKVTVKGTMKGKKRLRHVLLRERLRLDPGVIHRRRELCRGPLELFDDLPDNNFVIFKLRVVFVQSLSILALVSWNSVRASSTIRAMALCACSRETRSPRRNPNRASISAYDLLTAMRMRSSTSALLGKAIAAAVGILRVCRLTVVAPG